MIYRQFPRNHQPISAVSLGMEHLLPATKEVALDVISAAIDHGMNYADLFMGEDYVRDWVGESLTGRREKMMIAGHLGSTIKDKQYYRTRDVDYARWYIEDLLTRLKSDYIDMLMLHYVDDDQDADACLDEKGFLGLAMELLKAGKARMLGFSSHVPEVASRLVTTGLFDAALFSVNPLADLMPADATLEDLFSDGKNEALLSSSQTMNPQRAAFYRQCEAMGTGIIVMKGYGAGRILKLGWKPEQCIEYALCRPGVVSVAAGCRSVAEVEAAAAYADASPEERDFSGLVQQFNWNDRGLCMYCNHCLPCPQNIDIAAVHRLFDRTREGDTNAAAAYAQLPAAGGDCIACGSCEKRCPFGVPVAQNMAAAHQLLGDLDTL